MSYVFKILAGILSGIFVSMGMGGGSIFIIYLTFFEGFSQISAQGTNIIFFIPTAICAILIYNKRKLIKWKIATPLITWGIFGTLIGSFAVTVLDKNWLQKIFAVFLVVMSIKIFISK